MITRNRVQMLDAHHSITSADVTHHCQHEEDILLTTAWFDTRATGTCLCAWWWLAFIMVLLTYTMLAFVPVAVCPV